MQLPTLKQLHNAHLNESFKSLIEAPIENIDSFLKAFTKLINATTAQGQGLTKDFATNADMVLLSLANQNPDMTNQINPLRDRIKQSVRGIAG